MVSVKSLSESASKFERRASSAGSDYTSGVESVSDSEQQSATLEAESNWEQGINDAISEGRFSEGVRNPNKSWQRAAVETGSQRFTQGAAQAGDTWSEAFQPFADTLESLSLDARGPRGSEVNYQRSRQVGEALNRERDS